MTKTTAAIISLFFILVMLNISDTVTTFIGLEHGAIETNPAVASNTVMMLTVGKTFYLTFLGIVIYLTIFLSKKKQVFTETLKIIFIAALLACCYFTLSVVINNLIVLRQIL